MYIYVQHICLCNFHIYIFIETIYFSINHKLEITDLNLFWTKLELYVCSINITDKYSDGFFISGKIVFFYWLLISNICNNKHESIWYKTRTSNFVFWFESLLNKINLLLQWNWNLFQFTRTSKIHLNCSLYFYLTLTYSLIYMVPLFQNISLFFVCIKYSNIYWTPFSSYLFFHFLFLILIFFLFNEK